MEKLRTEHGNSYPVGNWGEYNGTTWYWEHHCDLQRNAIVKGDISRSGAPGHLEVSGFPDNWESYKEARSGIFWNEDGSWTDYSNCVWDGGIFVIEETSWNWNLEQQEGHYEVKWNCRKPERAIPTPQPTATPQPTRSRAWPTPTRPPARTPRTARPSAAEITDDRGFLIGNYACVESGGETLIKDITYAGTSHDGGPTGKGVESDPDWDTRPYGTDFLQVWLEQEEEFEHWKYQYQCLISPGKAIEGIRWVGGWAKMPFRGVWIKASGFDNNHRRHWELGRAMNSIQGFIRQVVPEETLTIEIDPAIGPFCGVAGGTHIAIKSEICGTGGIIAHEAAHIWFWSARDGRNWIDEGAADFIAAKIAPTLWTEEQSWETTRCDEYKNISELERANPIRGDNCLYTLGLGIFLTLSELDPVGFPQRLGTLSQVQDPSIHNVVEILGNTEKAKNVIAEWYYGEPNLRNTVRVKPWNMWEECPDCWD